MQMHYHGHLIKFAYVITREIQKRRVDLNALEQVRVTTGSKQPGVYSGALEELAVSVPLVAPIVLP